MHHGSGRPSGESDYVLKRFIKQQLKISERNPSEELRCFTDELAGEKRTNAQVWEEMRRLQRLGVEAKADEEAGDALEALKEAQMSPFEGLPQKVKWNVNV